MQVAAKELIGIEITKEPSKTRYIEGEIFDKTGIELKATYNNGSTKTLTSEDVTVGNGNDLWTGKAGVTIIYKENGIRQIAIQRIYVKAKKLVKIEITKEPSKTSYIEGEKFEEAGMEVVATFNNNSTEKINNADLVITNGDNLKVGKNTIIISYTEDEITKTASFDVEAVQQVQFGDISGDGKVNVTDLLLLKRHIIAGTKENWKLTGDKLKAADLNNDNKVNITDLLLLKRMILKKN